MKNSKLGGKLYMYADLLEFAILWCMFYLNISVLPRARFEIVWRRFFEEGENSLYVPEYEFKNFGLALLFPATFIIGKKPLLYYEFMGDEKILECNSYNSMVKKTFWLAKFLYWIFSLAVFVITAPLVTIWWGLRWLYIICIAPVVKKVNPKIESPDITSEQIKQRLAVKESLKKLPAVVPILPPVRGDWQNQEYLMPEKVTVDELIN